MNHNHQFTGGYDFLLAGEPPYRQLVCCMVSVLSSALAHTILYSPWVIYFLCIALDKSFEELFYFGEAAMDNVLLLIFGSPSEKELRIENSRLLAQYNVLSHRLDDAMGVLQDIQQRDDNLYRVILQSDPVSPAIRQAGYGGTNRYEELMDLANAKLVVNTTQKLDVLSKRLYIQSKSFDDVVDSTNLWRSRHLAYVLRWSFLRSNLRMFNSNVAVPLSTDCWWSRIRQDLLLDDHDLQRHWRYRRNRLGCCI